MVGHDDLAEILRVVPTLRIAVVGDFALDAYWDVAAPDGETSLETGEPVRRVIAQRYSPGGAGNVVANLRSLGVETVHAVGLVGCDPFAATLREALTGIGARVDALHHDPAWSTLVFAKPHVDGVEQSRLDFGTRNLASAAGQRAIEESLAALAARVDAIVVNQQVVGRVVSDAVLARLDVLRAGGTRLLIDARDPGARLPGVAVKLNAHEARRALGRVSDPRAPVSVDEGRALLAPLRERGLGPPLFVTLGSAGLLVDDGRRVSLVEAIVRDGPVDSVGAGDTVSAALIVALASGAAASVAARFAACAAAVTVRKIGTTGTVRPDEVAQVWRESAR